MADIKGKGEKRFVFVIGGARSGKSSFALRLSESILSGGKRVYLATAEALDAEMEERIGLHKRTRGDAWKTIEEPRDVVKKINGVKGGVILLDCVTLWISNLMHSGLGDAGIMEEASRLTEACLKTGASVVAVSNEVGLSIVPENPSARRFRDLSGSINQKMAGAAGEVYLVAAGIPLRLK